MKEQIEWINDLEKIEIIAKNHHEIEIKKILEILSGRGIFICFILLNLPFCLPLQIPGLSTPFGIILCLLSLRLIFRRNVSFPSHFATKKIKSKHLIKFIQGLRKCFLFVKKISRKRLIFLIQGGPTQRLHGIFFLFCSFFLSIPFPIPLTNFLAAMPVVAISLGILEEDGLLVILGYAIVSVFVFLILHTLFTHA